jgi:hypothetical protein
LLLEIADLERRDADAVFAAGGARPDEFVRRLGRRPRSVSPPWSCAARGDVRSWLLFAAAAAEVH